MNGCLFSIHIFLSSNTPHFKYTDINSSTLKWLYRSVSSNTMERWIFDMYTTHACICWIHNHNIESTTNKTFFTDDQCFFFWLISIISHRLYSTVYFHFSFIFPSFHLYPRISFFIIFFFLLHFFVYNNSIVLYRQFYFPVLNSAAVRIH